MANISPELATESRSMTVDQINNDWFVRVNGVVVAGPFPDNAAAWRWIDRYEGEGKSMPQFPAERSDSISGGVKDRVALDLKAIELSLRIAALESVQRVMPQIEAVLREAYPDKEIPD
jgi:hypothetical protein